MACPRLPRLSLSPPTSSTCKNSCSDLFEVMLAWQMPVPGMARLFFMRHLDLLRVAMRIRHGFQFSWNCSMVLLHNQLVLYFSFEQGKVWMAAKELLFFGGVAGFPTMGTEVLTVADCYERESGCIWLKHCYARSNCGHAAALQGNVGLCSLVIFELWGGSRLVSFTTAKPVG